MARKNSEIARRLFLASTTLLWSAVSASAYNVALSTAYINSWYNTTSTPPDGFVTHVNSPTYTWYYCDPCRPKKLRVIKTNNGDGKVNTAQGEDCANFGSQVLKAGGVTGMSGGGVGGTIPGVEKLAAALKSIATETRFCNTCAVKTAPANLGPGDIVIWNTYHTTEVMSGNANDVVLSAHSYDTKGENLSHFFASITSQYGVTAVARAFHITGSAMTMPTTNTPPGVNIRRNSGASVQDSGFTNGQTVSVDATDFSGQGIDFFEVTVGEALVDRIYEAMTGLGADLIVDSSNYGASHTYSVDLSRLLLDGTTVNVQVSDGDGNQTIQTFQLDRTPPNQVLVTDINDQPIVSTSATTVKVTGSDALSGAYTITLSSSGGSQTSTNTTPSPNVPYTATFSGLMDGSYSVSVQDISGNVSNSVEFSIKRSGASTGNNDAEGNTLPATFPSTYCVAGQAVDSSGIASITMSGPGGFSDVTLFDCDAVQNSTDAVGHLRCGLANGAYTTTSINCAGVPSSAAFTVTAGTNTGIACLGTNCQTFTPTTSTVATVVVNTQGPCGGCDYLDFCARAALTPRTSCPNLGGFPAMQNYIGPCSRSISFSIVNPTTATWVTPLLITAGAGGTVSFSGVSPPSTGTSLSGFVSIPQGGAICPAPAVATGATVRSSYWKLLATLATFGGKYLASAVQSNLAYFPGSFNAVFGSDVVLNSSGTITFSLENPPSIVVSTESLAIYRFDGAIWSSAAVTSQTVSKDPTTSVISATGSIVTSGYYALFFDGNDSSSPVTTSAIQGRSYDFDGALFVSTDAFIVLSATDPVVNGYASTVASITYRMDPSSGAPFYIYSSSIPLPLGTHILEYRSLDYAGNAEAIKTATFTVTAGTAFRTGNTAQVPGVLLNGFLGSGAKLEIESQAQNSLTLLISSANRQGMVAVDNIGEVGIGVTPQANLNIGQGAIGLQLRSGNSTSSVTSNQIAFGYNGDSSMRHLLRTEHSTSTDGNKLDFLVWNTGAGSTAAVAGLNVLSLQGIATASGGSFHVQPVGEPDAEVEVSNGLSTGGGTMQRLQVVSPSSRRFKTDIKDLSEADEDRALAEVAGLRHATFRYKTRTKDGRLVEDPAQPLRIGLIYEDAPASIRDGAESISTTERLVNVEMALRAAMRRLEALQARHARLKAGRKP